MPHLEWDTGHLDGRPEAGTNSPGDVARIADVTITSIGRV